MSRLSPRVEAVGFAILSGLISFFYNVVMIVVPLRMSDHGLPYAVVGGAMSAVSIGLIVVKLAIGHLSDLFGSRRFILTALLGLAIAAAGLGTVENLWGYILFMALMGVFRGIFTAVSGSYVFDLADQGGYGRVYGAVLSVNSLMASIGGMIAGALYRFGEGRLPLYLCSGLLALGLAWAWRGLSAGQSQPAAALSAWHLLKGIRPGLWVFCLLTFLQSFAIGPLWNFILPMYCYNIMGFSAAWVGVLMAADELISTPTSLLAGQVVDRIHRLSRWNALILVCIAVCGVCLGNASGPVPFMAAFLLCSVGIASSYVGLPRQRFSYINLRQKGFELALISLCGNLGDALGSQILGQVADRYPLSVCLAIFSGVYLVMALLALFCRKADRPAAQE